MLVFARIAGAAANSTYRKHGARPTYSNFMFFLRAQKTRVRPPSQGIQHGPCLICVVTLDFCRRRRN